jgi:TRAP-type uncharacterized transport system substrate-binding protein
MSNTRTITSTQLDADTIVNLAKPTFTNFDVLTCSASITVLNQYYLTLGVQVPSS